MKNILFILLLVGVFCSCSPQKRLQRLLKNHPELIEKSRDTVIVKSRSIDTVFRESGNKKDTVIIQKNKMILKYFRNRDTVYLHSKYVGDTIIRPIYKIIKMKEGIIGDYFNWKYLLLGVLVLGVLVLIVLLVWFRRG